MLALGAWLVISGEATRRRDDRDHHPARPRARAGRAGRRQLAHAGRRPRRVPPPARHCSTAADAQPRAHGAAGAERRAASRRTWCSARRRANACCSPACRCSSSAGESLAVIGASGAGKSTLVRLLTGVWKPSAGTVRLDQRRPVAMAARRPRPVARLRAAGRRAVPRHRGREHRAPRRGRLGAGRAGRAARPRARADPVAARGLRHRWSIRRARCISPGQRQRIALARALYGDPKLVILDEPNSNLDGAGEQALAETLKALRGQVTVVVVTHRSTLIQHVDKMLVLEAGRVQHYGAGRRGDAGDAAAKAPAAGVGAQVVAMRAPRACDRHAARRARSWRHERRRDAVADPQAPLRQHLREARRLARRGALRAGARPACRCCAWLALAPLSAAVVAQALRQGRPRPPRRAACRRRHGARGQGARRPARRAGRAAAGARRRRRSMPT